MFKAFLIKYGEIGIKGKNRYLFEDALMKQIRFALEKVDGDFEVTKQQGRVYVYANGDYDYDETMEALSRVFGIVHICPVVICDDPRWENLTKVVGDYMDKAYEDKDFSFKVESRRADKRYPKKSMELSADMGEYLLGRFPGLKVDVRHPDVLLNIEVREKTYIYSKSIPGPGGMPVGTNGTAMLLLSGGIDSPVAGYMIAKRGVRIQATYFHAPPYTSERAKQKVIDLAKIVARYAGPIRLNVVNFTDIQLAIYERCPHEELTIIMRRYMMRIAERIAREDGALALVTGESIGQVASQTIQSLAATNAVCDMPVFRPVIGFDKDDIVKISEKIGAFETSILPFEDCCTIFVAKHPVTKPSVRGMELSERKLEGVIEDLVEEALATKEVVICE